MLNNEQVSVIEANTEWKFINFKELFEYKDLFYFLVWRNLKSLYAQTVLGISWAIIQPLIQIVIFSIVFGKIAKLSSEGIPYVLFTTVAIVPWTYMSQTMTASSQSLVTGSNLLGKVYFPRVIFPITPALSKVIDFMLSVLIIICISLYFKVVPTWNLLFFPVLVIFMMIFSVGIGMWFSAMAIRYRDVKYAMPFAIRILMYSAPIVYSAAGIPEKYRIIYSINPIVGLIEGYRACIIGLPMPWQFILPGLVTAIVIFISGAFYFKRMERIFVDVM